jgi:hypothetical protein
MISPTPVRLRCNERCMYKACQGNDLKVLPWPLDYGGVPAGEVFPLLVYAERQFGV